MARLRAAASLTAIAGASLLAGVAAAEAHVSVEPAEAPAEGYAKLSFNVGHGCEDSPTTSISIQMPDQVVSATPQVVPGWKIETKEGPLPQPVESHGESVTEGVREITWKGGELDPHQLEVFGISVRLMGKPGETVPFKVVQRCQQGELAWIEVAEEGQPEPETPAPVVELVAGGDSHSEAHDADDAAASDDAHDDSSAAEHAEDDDANTAAARDADDDGDGPLPVIALVVAVVALLLAAASFFKRRS